MELPIKNTPPSICESIVIDDNLYYKTDFTMQTEQNINNHNMGIDNAQHMHLVNCDSSNLETTDSVRGINSTHDTNLSNGEMGIINGSTSSSGSLVFDGFTSGDLKNIGILGAISSSTGSSPTISEDDFEYKDIVYHSTDTLPADYKTDDTTTKQVNNLSTVQNKNTAVDPIIMELWVKDAKTKRWFVPLNKLSKGDVCTLSQPAPDKLCIVKPLIPVTVTVIVIMNQHLKQLETKT